MVRLFFNEAGLDADFRFEGDTEANLLFLDASTDLVGIGTAAPARALHIQYGTGGGGIGNEHGLIVENTVDEAEIRLIPGVGRST